jgi:2,4'-dihydroxyacetophenone dioxygenase
MNGSPTFGSPTNLEEVGPTARLMPVPHETPGEGHTLVAYESEEPMKVFFQVKGPLIWLDENGESNGYFDVHNYIEMCRAHYEKVGIGADYITKLFR